ncbi:MAG: PilT/PilU family type 4a pilus ATPase [bacterium]|nr:PilT/PilU family type 4a pilus ATPase [bacterium]
MKGFNLNQLLEGMLKVSDRISDLNFSAGSAPQVEIDGELQAVKFPGLERLLPFQTEIIALHLLKHDSAKVRTLVETGSTDVSYAIPGKTRFRVNIFRQRGAYSIVMRAIPSGVPTIEELGLPAELGEISDIKNGIVLVTGPTGSGKSTTLAAVINKINHEKAYHIVTIEDPIEYLHPHRKSVINQREVGTDTKTFGLALRAALRQAPKVILIGEMRDVETIEIAMEAAETGHLVLSTLHTVDAAKTVERIVGVFPKDQESFIRTRLAAVFRYIISQRLLPKPGGGRLAVLEILKSTLRTRDYIVKGEGDGRSLVDAMKDGDTEGMQHFDMELERLVREKIIPMEEALLYATNPTNLALEMADLDQFAGDVEVADLAEETPEEDFFE